MTSFAAMSGESEGAFIVPIVFFTIVVLCGTVYIVSWLTKRSKDKIRETSKTQVRGSNLQQKSKSSASKPLKKKAPLPKVATGTPQHKFDHPHLLATLKGHTGPLTGGDFSSNGKQFITSAEDRTVLLWNTKDFANRDRKSSRGNIEFDHAQHICWSPDSKAFLIFKAVESAIEVYKIVKKQNGHSGEIQKAFVLSEYNRDVTVIALGVAVNGKFMMTCDEKNQLILWDLKGKILEKIDTRHGDTYSAVISPCGRFVVTTGFTPDAKVWEIRYNKNGGYECAKRVFELKGHSSGIYNCSINCDSSKMVTISKDGTWRLYNTQVEFEKDQEPYFMLSGQYNKSEFRPFVAVSPDGRTVVVASGPDLTFYSAFNGDTLYSIDSIYYGCIKEIKFDPSSKYLLTIGDKHTRVFLNVAGYHTTIQDLEKSKSNAKTTAMKERISAQILEAKTSLKNIKMNIS